MAGDSTDHLVHAEQPVRTLAVTPVTSGPFVESRTGVYGSMKRNSSVSSTTRSAPKDIVTVAPTGTSPATEEPARTRPRVEGERELEILEATLETLVDLGYDKLSFDAVASAAKA